MTTLTLTPEETGALLAVLTMSIVLSRSNEEQQLLVNIREKLRFFAAP